MTKRIFFLLALFCYMAATGQAVNPDNKDPVKIRHLIYGDSSDRNNRSIKLFVYCKNTGDRELAGQVEISVYNKKGLLVGTLSKDTLLVPKEEIKNAFHYPLPEEGIYTISCSFIGDDGKRHFGKSFTWKAAPVNFAFAFTTPHRITVGPPDDSHRTLVDVYPDKFKMSWTYDNLVQYDPLPSYRPPVAMWKIICQPLLNGRPFENSDWGRIEGSQPSFCINYKQENVVMQVQGIGASSAAILKIELSNHSKVRQKIALKAGSPIGWMGINPAWVDSTKEANRLLAGWQAPANQVLLFGSGADRYPVVGSADVQMEWDLLPGESKSGWLIRPYQEYNKQMPHLAATNWNAEFEQSKDLWTRLIHSGSEIILPDTDIMKAYYACLSDLFIMREPIAKGYIGVVPGTEVYRTAPNSCEPAIVSVAFDRAGYPIQSENGFRVNLDIQEEDGNWTEVGGWANTLWAVSGYKSWQIMEHFKLAKDTAFLQKRFPQMVMNARFQESQRLGTRVLVNSSRPLTYGLMPRGMGDGGLNDSDDLYGVFYMHNIWAVYADSLALWAAKALNKPEYIDELAAIYHKGRNDLVTAMERGKITEPDGTEWLSASPGKVGGSRWGILNVLYPTGILRNGDKLVEGTLKYVEKNMSIGGIHVHTGWLKDGMWVALSLDNFAEAYLYRRETVKAAKLLYATINHGTPFYTWCEERGQEPGSTTVSGDLEHLWTPVALVRYVREALVLEEGDSLHLALGADPLWVNSHRNIGVDNAPTPFGKISYIYRYDTTGARITGKLTFKRDYGKKFTVVLHTGIGEGLVLSRVSRQSKAFIGKDRQSLCWDSPEGEINFEATVRPIR